VPSNPFGIDAHGNLLHLLPERQSSGEVIAGWLPTGVGLAMAFGSMSADILESASNRQLVARAGCEDDHRDGAAGFARGFGELRVVSACSREEALALLACGLLGDDIDRLGSDLDSRVGLRFEVVVPVGVVRRSAVCGPDQVARIVGQAATAVASSGYSSA
jgi:hypothetical protein